MDWAAFLKRHNLEHSMSRRGNCHDNAVAESFFNLLKRERNTTQDLSNTRGSKAGRVRLYRDVLQPETKARQERDDVTVEFERQQKM